MDDKIPISPRNRIAPFKIKPIVKRNTSPVDED